MALSIQPFGLMYSKVCRRRRAALTHGADGRPIQGALEEEFIQALVKPATAQDLRDVPEGLRTAQTLIVITRPDCELRGADESKGQEPDIIVHKGEEWSIIRLFDHTTTRVLPHYRGIAQRAVRR